MPQVPSKVRNVRDLEIAAQEPMQGLTGSWLIVDLLGLETGEATWASYSNSHTDAASV